MPGFAAETSSASEDKVPGYDSVVPRARMRWTGAQAVLFTRALDAGAGLLAAKAAKKSVVTDERKCLEVMVECDVVLWMNECESCIELFRYDTA